MVKFWFDNFLVKKLGYAMTNADLVRGVARRFDIPIMIVGPNVFPDRVGIFPDHIDEIAARCPKKRGFIVTDKFCVRYIKKIIDCFEKRHNFIFEIYDKILPECPTENIIECGKAMSQFEPDVIFAVGGGSVIDGAKLSWIFYEKPDFNVFEEFDVFTTLNLRKKAFLIAIPTTSGTGSETTAAAIFKVDLGEGKHMKAPIASPELKPDYALLDPTLTYDMPPKLTAGTGLDALAHAIFGIVGPGSNDFSDALGLQAIKMIFKYLPRAFRNGKDREARLKMITAASLAGICFDRGGSTGINHSMGHQLGAMFKIHHGIAVGLFITYGLQFYYPLTTKYLDICEALNIRDDISNEQSLKNLCDKVNQLLKELDLPTDLKGLGISRTDFEEKLTELAENTLNDPTSFTSPVPLDLETYKLLYSYAFDGKDVPLDLILQ
ncbi:MAG: iron-containing alcohol dehydrogenase [Promethearchaeota archaeon]|nr:MAG: iron-containing alcohol dehydrogenase [Candidatus Lokiarchaeota archaeon]